MNPPVYAGPLSNAEKGRGHMGNARGAAPVVTEIAGALGRGRGGDVGPDRERLRQRRLRGLAMLLGPLTGWLWWRLLSGDPVDVTALAFPQVDWLLVAPLLFFVLLILLLLGTQMGAGRSPHVLYRPGQIDVRLDDVVGIDPVRDEVVRSIDLFLAHTTFADQMGGTPRRGLLFEGPPGTGKTHLAKAMAAETGVPFLYVSATAFQSMYYGATARKIRSYFRVLRRVARREGGAIGFIEEIDAIATVRGGMRMGSAAPALAQASGRGGPLRCDGMVGLPSSYAESGAATPVQHPSVTSEGVGGVVNELLVQMQSFDEPTGLLKLRRRAVSALNLFLPAHRQLRTPAATKPNILLIAATNRGDDLDPALLRPGRFDRRLHFDPPAKEGRRALVDHFLARKSHTAELDEDERRDALAGVTQGFTPVMIEHLLDEALAQAVCRGATAMSWADLEQARLSEAVGLGQPVGYTDHEARLIATHEAGHATVAWLVAPHRRLEVLTIIKRGQALGLLAHGDRDDVYTRSSTEMRGLVQIAFGGQVAEELFFGDVSTGPGGDLLYATNVAAEMVGACGMTDTLISYAAVQSGALSGTNVTGRVLGDGEGRSRVEGLLREQKEIVRTLVRDNSHLVAALRDALLERHELVGSEITDVLDAASPLGMPLRVPGPRASGATIPAVVDLRDSV
ncbi:AAA family ATPase [soil metagenome]